MHYSKCLLTYLIIRKSLQSYYSCLIDEETKAQRDSLSHIASKWQRQILNLCSLTPEPTPNHFFIVSYL